jgi:DNA-binding transcriptional ArsR family regulator
MAVVTPRKRDQLPERPFGQSGDDFIDLRLLYALNSPTRLKILGVLMKQEASPAMMTKILGQGLGDLAYHTRTLHECGCIELTGTRRRRGATVHLYRALPQALGGRHFWNGLPETLQGSVVFASLRQLVQQLALIAGNGGLDLTTSALDSARLFLDREGQRDAVELIESASTQLVELDRQSRVRNSQGDSELAPFEAGVAFFPVAGKDLDSRTSTDPAGSPGK